MSRTADAELKNRILDVALTLLRVHGEKGVTLRDVARAAGTTTPTVYKRFPDKESLLLAIAMRERESYVQRQAHVKSLEEAATLYLDWAMHHPHEYGLIYGPNFPRIFSAESGRPGLRWSQEQFARRYGGDPADYEAVIAGLWLMLHGAASLLSQESRGPAARYIREQCLIACDQIIRSAETIVKRNLKMSEKRLISR